MLAAVPDLDGNLEIGFVPGDKFRNMRMCVYMLQLIRVMCLAKINLGYIFSINKSWSWIIWTQSCFWFGYSLLCQDVYSASLGAH